MTAAKNAKLLQEVAALLANKTLIGTLYLIARKLQAAGFLIETTWGKWAIPQDTHEEER
jgi:hypothetical protein